MTLSDPIEINAAYGELQLGRIRARAEQRASEPVAISTDFGSFYIDVHTEQVKGVEDSVYTVVVQGSPDGETWDDWPDSTVAFSTPGDGHQSLGPAAPADPSHMLVRFWVDTTSGVDCYVTAKAVLAQVHPA